jgi:hypothetical protein
VNYDESIFIANTLNDPRSWGPTFLEVNCDASIIIRKSTAEEMAVWYKEFKGLSVCDTRSFPTQIHILKENWDCIPAASGFTSRDDYRRYVVLHEMGHALGHGHKTCAIPGSPAPIMMQQTLGTGLCKPNPWVNNFISK